MSKFDKVIKNSTIVTASDTYKGDIGIKDGIITEIGQNLDCENVIDATDKLIIPGGIDAHTHLDMPFGGTFSSDYFETGSKAAAIGGTTAIIDYCVQPGDGTLADGLKVWKESLSLNKVVEVTATNVAKVFGMYPKKGTIAIGSDADLALYDPNKEVTLTKSILHENVDYTAFEGIKLNGYPVMTLSRGDVIAKDGEYIGTANRGQFIKRNKSQLL